MMARLLALISIVALGVTSAAASQSAPIWLRYPAISPDGKTIVFTFKDDLYRVAAAPGAVQRQGIDRVSWMRGCWEQVSGDRTTEEQWLSPRGGSMIGMSRTVGRSRMLEYEFIVIREDGGALVYEAHPSGQHGASFRSVEIGEASAVFENRQHDFPQRIGYERLSPDRLLAWIEGARDGKTRRVEFRYDRTACAAR
jgi:hypothetical protein